MRKRSTSAPEMVLECLAPGEFVEVHLKLCVVVGDRVRLRLFKDHRGACDHQFAALLQVVADELGGKFFVLVGHYFLESLVDLIEVGHFGFGPHLLDSAAMAVAEGVDAVEGLGVEIFRKSCFDL